MWTSKPDGHGKWRALHKRYVGAARPRYRILVNDSVTEEVRRRWAARGVTNIAMLGPGLPPRSAPGLLRRNLLGSKALFLGTGAVATSATVSTGGIAWLAGALTFVEPTTGLLWTGGVAAVTGAGTAWTGVRYSRDPRRLRRNERAAARDAVWITPEALRVPGPRGGMKETDEQRLFHLLCALAQRIVATRAWTHESLQGHMSKLDLDHLVSGIGARLLELTQLRREMERIRSPHSERQLRAVERRLQEAFDSAAARVEGLEGYLQRLLALDELLLKLDHLERSRELGARVLDVLAKTADDEDADWRLQDLNLEAESHAEVIQRLLEELEESADELSFPDPQPSRLPRTSRGDGTHGSNRPGPAASDMQPGASTEHPVPADDRTAGAAGGADAAGDADASRDADAATGAAAADVGPATDSVARAAQAASKDRAIREDADEGAPPSTGPAAEAGVAEQDPLGTAADVLKAQSDAILDELNRHRRPKR
ncbi:hypothetical protein [Sediminivirga luteola]|uniref:Uncharacterized protein n=1 Tax=Sediminivirga luteola TaxID=1774748 RepID=A0A8J2XKC8_9MICO|nr:hypothetical protein [Sediminivirga luteola]GGA12715.1 hypothetical protein GCM10011333_14510 [Sediminivirga luteola]